jgi:hypothetical protein
MKRLRRNVPKIPKPETRPVKTGAVEAKWDRKAITEAAPPGAIRPEEPLLHFHRDQVESRVSAFLSEKLNNPQPARARNKNAGHLITGTRQKTTDVTG